MLKRILYDRVISVTLYRKEKEVPSLYQAIAPDTYKELKINNRKVLQASQERITTGHPLQVTTQSSIGVNFIDNERSQKSWLIEFYQGDYMDVYVGVQETQKASGQGKTYKARYKRIRAKGPKFTFNTLEDMKKGVRPDGSPLQTGDRIHVTEDHSSWNVYAEGSTAGAYTSETREVPASVLNISTTDSGMKPDITLTISLLPGQNCYGATLKIRNFNIDPVSIRDWDKMVIEAGYRSGKTVIYNCPIFSGYIESPNPDGTVVFEGLTVGVAEDVLTDKFLVVKFLQKQVTLERLIRDVAKGISANTEVNIALSDKYSQAIVDVSKQYMYAQNGMALLNWLQTFVSEFLYKYTDGVTTAFLQLVDNRLDVIAINGENKQPISYENIVNLDMVTGATFTGTSLTVVAPWNPELQPGELFFMPPQFINGAKLPNTISLEDYRNAENLYRALTMTVEFASTGPENKMTVLAVPAQWAGKLPDGKTTSMRADVYGELLTTIYQKSEDDIPVGVQDESPVPSAKAEEQETTGVSFIDEASKILTQWTNGWDAITQSTTTGDCISKIARYYLYEMKGGPVLTEGAGNARQRSYNESRSYFTQNNLAKAITYYQNTGVSAQYLWWPLIAVGTYWRREEDIKANASHNWSRIRPDNPNFIEAGKAVYVPRFPSGNWTDNRSKFAAVKDVWAEAYLSYKDLYGDSCKVWRAMYYYLGGTRELD